MTLTHRLSLTVVLSLASAAAAQSHTLPLAPALRPYASCKALPDGVHVVETTRLPPENHIRTAQTLTGPTQIALVDGVAEVFEPASGLPIANVKIEQLPTAKYDQEKKDLTSEWEKILATGAGESSRNYGLKPTLGGFEITGFDRNRLEGNVLGIYLLFDNPHHVVITVYFLNQDPSTRNFSTITEYFAIRDRFLGEFTNCMRSKLSGAPATSRPRKR